MRMIGESISLMRNSSPKNLTVLAHTHLVELFDLM